MLNYFPKYFTSRAIYLYLFTVMGVAVLFYNYTMSWYWYVFGLMSVVCFFYFSNTLTKKWSSISKRLFTRRIFLTALVIRVLWVIFSYFFYIEMTGQPFEFSAADSIGYNEMGNWIRHLILNEGSLQPYWNSLRGGYSDSGYILYLGVIYSIFGQSIIITRLIKAIISAFTCILIYRFATRTFNESVGRMSAVFCMLMPNLIYYCGLHLKETEMLFLTVAFLERADFAIRSKKLTLSNLVLPIILVVSLFFFRIVLGATALLAFFSALIFTPGRTLKGPKRLLLILWVLIAVAYFMGGKIATEVEEVWENRTENQANSMEWRSKREGGNEFAKYMSGAVFAPGIFIIPFPTVVDIPIQENQKLIHGGNYVKNVMAFFTMFALIWILRKKKWKDFTLIGAFVIGYLIVIAFSAFAHSERFHLPVLPFELMIAAYGVSLVTNKTKKYYNFYLAFLLIAIVAWSWFKLAGRGLV